MNDHITATASFLDQLRSQTQAAHQKLESLPVSLSITNPEVTRPQYVHYLQLMLDVIGDTESKIFALVANVVPQIDARKKLQWIENDLKFLDAARSASRKVLDTEGISVPFALGIFYTVEGATMGGRYIFKNIASALNLDAINGASYFNGYGNQSGQYWKEFLNALTDYAQSAQTQSEIIDGATYAFDAIYKHFAAAQQ